MIYRAQTTPNNLINFYSKIISSVDMGKRTGCAHLDYSKAFSAVSHSLLLDALARYRWGELSARWAGNSLTDWSQKVVTMGFYSGWQPVTGHSSRINKFNPLINHWDDGIENAITRFAHDTSEGRLMLQRAGQTGRVE